MGNGILNSECEIWNSREKIAKLSQVPSSLYERRIVQGRSEPSIQLIIQILVSSLSSPLIMKFVGAKFSASANFNFYLCPLHLTNPVQLKTHKITWVLIGFNFFFCFFLFFKNIQICYEISQQIEIVCPNFKLKILDGWLSGCAVVKIYVQLTHF